MFNNNQKAPAPVKAPKRGTAPKDTAVTILTSSCHFNGKLYCRGSSRIGGRIEGQIVSEGLLIIEDSAVISADVKVEEAIIQGRVKGKVEASGRVELCPTSNFEGDIVTPALIVREGAQFNGRSTMTTPRAVSLVSTGGSIADSLSDLQTDRLDTAPTLGDEIHHNAAMMKAPEFSAS